MRIGIMQPYFFPYIGYFQLMSAVDKFVVYDNIKFTKKGWINRNRILTNGKDEIITLPLKKDSDFLNVDQRFLAETWSQERKVLLNKITNNYKKAPFFKNVIPIVEECLFYDDYNLFNFIVNSIFKIKEFLNIETELIVSSSIAINHELKSQDKVIAICKSQGATVYINPIGGLELYNNETFASNQIDLFFLKTNDFKYPQFKHDFISFLSIIDILMFNEFKSVSSFLKEAILIKN